MKQIAIVAYAVADTRNESRYMSWRIDSIYLLLCFLTFFFRTYSIHFVTVIRLPSRGQSTSYLAQLLHMLLLLKSLLPNGCSTITLSTPR